MKTLNLYSLITILIVTTFNATAQKTKKNTENFLEITGSVLLNDHRTTKYSISELNIFNYFLIYTFEIN